MSNVNPIIVATPSTMILVVVDKPSRPFEGSVPVPDAVPDAAPVPLSGVTAAVSGSLSAVLNFFKSASTILRAIG